MIVLQCSQVSKSFGAETVLKNAKLEVKSNERVALVGRNGAGKSTLLKIITGELSHDEGTVMIPKEVSIGYLAQDSGLASERSIWEEMMTVFEPLKKIERKLRSLEEKMADPDRPDYEQVLADYDQLQQDFRDRGGYQYEADIRSILSGLNFEDYDYSTPIASLSGGQKTRLSLGKLLLAKPELLILDEPTNHLDIDTLTWLENYLSGYSGALLIVSHDRYFLDRVVDNVFEMTFQKTYHYPGNYTNYLEQRALRFEQEMREYEKQQEEIKKLEDFVAKNIARDSTSNRAKSRRKKLEKIERIDKPMTEDESAKFRFDIERQTGNDVLMIEQLAFGYSEPLLSNVTLKMTRGESVALIGPNGIGKSTLLKTIAGQLDPMDGSIRYGSNVHIGYYDQEQTALNPKKNVLHELWDDYPQTKEKDIRTVLGNFLFSGEDVLKSVHELSGGEKARLSLAKLMMEKPNVLILDEPTNHLDLDSKEVLENALIDYPGTILFVSHDRYFVNRMATRIAELSSQKLTNYLGDYDYYVEKKDEEYQWKQLEQAPEDELGSGSDIGKKSASEAGGEAKETYEKQKERQKEKRQIERKVAEIEQTIETNENRIAEIEELLCDPDIYQDSKRSFELNEEMEQLNNQNETKMEEWETLQNSTQ
ncbi:ATP-binding cassette domain-containing protein [Salisediminibacterium halotolerans]|uniref:ABC transporter ATP-binding protein n=1 Tax=Salisediminibacterium halotolerans TaxID=517425 RepID=UPI000EB0F023|nr:ATP-binding cassette domain-containing protein [Salisediminibacterium halotolerans]RLJ71638.1 ATP-binding cassette subfamily F protein 3 [Actinophytocola xinjiangensis]RPE86788.1 ATP-binding cassette subfamily F protein 3 [Salisediminibacterium halotolerans]TWG32851.1 ATP-binding cassette subfamily F protein 3 [Salisediminibacterium halotolerans]GEL06943.1 putative ABC transporter ATP-binding protein YdiF [Salisediminibacterium halotolerans]